jgi:aspartyl-tRNA(Asn)/glutamyl-tRNA(Gln) amidotransferase subunit C
MKLLLQQIEHVAKLASLPLSAQELETYPMQLSAILDYIDQLSKVDTEGVEPTYNVTGGQLEIVLPTDETVAPSLSQSEALSNTPSTKNGFFVTGGVFEEE